MGLVFECKRLAEIMKTKKQSMKKSTPQKLVKKRSVGRPRKSKIKDEQLSDSSSEDTVIRHTPLVSKIPIEKVQPIRQNTKSLLKPISEVQVPIYEILI